VLSEEDAERVDSEAMAIVDEAVTFADQSPFPGLDTLYEDLYVLGDQVKGWLVLDERSPDGHRGELELESGESADAYGLAEAGAAYARAGSAEEREQRGGEEQAGDEGSGEGESAGEERDVEGGGQ